MIDQDAVQAAVDGELRLLDPGVRASAALSSQLLDPEFVEFGASGTRWDLPSILAMMSSESPSTEPPIEVSEMSGTVLAPGVVHLTYLSDGAGRRARRSSIWRQTPKGWRLYFHQGTLTGA
ncbi:DUF4440 domain-containing protein [Actinospica robiniae]|uniref:nuclear transport factor 2 family protein n=1 Tax=Actinospica robiniae TaxID=304901 RepID=UPI0004288C47|nr:DUF4440 domain-containing protein [Actinospica robiniae]